jgi:uncharacterized protein
MKLKTKLLLILIFCCSFSGFSQIQSFPSIQHGLLWKITGNGLPQPSYLFGTFHDRGGKQILDSIKGFETIFHSTEQFVCESDLSNIDWLSAFKGDSSKSVSLLKPWPDKDSTYENLLTEMEKCLLDSITRSLYPKSNYRKTNLRPFVLHEVLKYTFNETNPPIPDIKTTEKKGKLNYMLDYYLFKKAKDSGMNVVTLDSCKRIMELSDSVLRMIPPISYKTEIDFLMSYVRNHRIIDSLKSEAYKKVLSVYLHQNLDFIQIMLETNTYETNFPGNAIGEPTETISYLRARKIITYDERNKLWMKRIPDLIIKNSCFIAVGAGHLVGETGLINQLRKLGFTVEPI